MLYDLNTSKNPDLPYWKYKRFDLDTLTDEECKTEFRFYRSDIYALCDVLEFPNEIKCYSGVKVDASAALCILLKHFAYPCRYTDLVCRFGRPIPSISIIANYMLSFMYSRWKRLLTSFEQDWLASAKLQQYAKAIHDRGAPLDNCFAFVDGTIQRVCRPGQNQRALYNGHKRVHANKSQAVSAPNGLCINLFGPVEGRRHDSGMLADSGLLTLL